MSVFSICAVGVLAAAVALLLRRQNPQISLLISVAAGVIILLSVIRYMLVTSDEIKTVLESGGISSDHILILLKAVGICFITEFTCDTVSEAGMMSLSSNISFAGKIMVLFTAMPLFGDLIAIITQLVNTA